MRRDVRVAAVEWQGAPTAAERRDSAIAILQIEEPANAFCDGLLGVAIDSAELCEREESTGRVISVGYAAGERGPCPSAWGCTGVGVGCGELLISSQARMDWRCSGVSVCS